jgi:methyl-accepting chemotaxis protein
VKWFANRTIGTKLNLAFGAILMLIASLGLFSIRQLSVVNKATVEIAAQWLPSVKFLGLLKYDLSATRQKELQYLMVSDNKEKSQAAVVEQSNKVTEDQKRYQSLIHSEEERRIFAAFSAKWDKYLVVHEKVVKLSKTNEYEAMGLAMTEGLQTYAAAADQLDQDVELNDKRATDAAATSAGVYASSLYWVVAGLSLAIALGLLLAFSFSRAFSNSFARMLTTIKAISAYDLTMDDLKVSSTDEIGQAIMSLNGMKNSLSAIIECVAGTAKKVAAASETLLTTSQQIAGNADETSAQANVVSAAAEEVSINVGVVATGSEEMLASIREISKNANDAARVTKSAVAAAEHTNRTITKLGDSSQQIGSVIKVITSIAQQTNLLALNATIEAARAGEAGKGFAVVANEVKELAKQTAQATEEIGRKIEAIQGDSKGAVQAIAEIGEIINQINDISSTIASAVEEQTATTNEIGRNVTEAAKGTGEIASNIASVAKAAQDTNAAANETQEGARSLREMAHELQTFVAKFKIKQNTATVAKPKGHAAAAAKL